MKSMSLWLYILIAVFTSLQGILSTDESKNMLDAVTLYYSKGSCGTILAALLAAKMYLSVPKPADAPPKPPTDSP